MKTDIAISYVHVFALNTLVTQILNLKTPKIKRSLSRIWI